MPYGMTGPPERPLRVRPTIRSSGPGDSKDMLIRERDFRVHLDPDASKAFGVGSVLSVGAAFPALWIGTSP